MGRNSEDPRRAMRERGEEDPPGRGEGRERRDRPRGTNPRVFLRVEIRGKLDAKVKAEGRLEIELYADTVPRTSENFRCLATGERGRDLSFTNCMFHSIVPGLMAQGGAISVGGGQGTPPQGRSIYGETFADEGFSRRHDARGVLSMANSGPNTNNSQFQLMFGRAAQLDKRHVVFGRVVRDEDGILDSIEQAGSRSGVPRSMVSIVDCGEVGGRSVAAAKSRSRSRKLPSRVQFRSDGLVDYRTTARSSRPAGGRQYASFSDIGDRR